MKNFITKERIKTTGKTLIAVVFWIVVWYIAAAAVNKQVLIASPVDVIRRLAELAGQKEFITSVLYSLLRILAGFAAGTFFGAILGYAGYFIKPLGILTSPLISVIKATPVASFIILALVWLQRGTVPSFTTFLMVLPIVWGNVTQGIAATDKNLTEMARVFGVGGMRRLLKIYIPSAAPYFTAAVKTALGLGWKAGIAAEVLCTPADSIGKQLYESKIYLETTDVFAWTAVIVIISFIIEKLFVFLIDRLSRTGAKKAKEAE